jgi:fido (protein-threonine AMPylation protein)
MINEKYIWKPLVFDENWLEVSTIKFDNIAPSWFRKRETLKENEKEYERFLERLKRQQAIETGIIERLYDLKQGITETFIKEGFFEDYIQHGDTNIQPKKLMDLLKDNFEAIDFIFDFVKVNRRISKSYLCELHQIITLHQNTIDVIDQFGNNHTVSLLKGKFKLLPNNPRRDDDTKFLYCPPEQVESEIESLLSIYYQLEEKCVSPIIRAAFFHHAFTQIHPFQDGNGRIARLMASLILVKGNLFPFAIVRNEKKEYIDSLEEADAGNFQPLIYMFCKIQIRNIESVLNLKTGTEDNNLKQAIGLFSEKVKKLKSIEAEERNIKINKNRSDIFEYCVAVLKNLVNSLKGELGGMVEITIKDEKPSGNLYYYFNRQIADYATQHKYYFNASLPRGWVRVNIKLSDKKKYDLIISLHHYGYDDSTLAIGAFLEFIDDSESNNDLKRKHYRIANEGKFINIPIEIKPLTLSVEIEIKKLETSIGSFIEDVFTVAIAHITNEI